MRMKKYAVIKKIKNFLAVLLILTFPAPGFAQIESPIETLIEKISTGTLGDDTEDTAAWRALWIDRLETAENYFYETTKEPPFQIVYNPKITWVNRDARVTISLYPDITWAAGVNEIIKTVKSGIDATGKSHAWELDWPVKTINSVSVFTNNRKNHSVTIEILTSDGKSIGSQTVELIYEHRARNGQITVFNDTKTIIFPALNANPATDFLIVQVTSIDGVLADRAWEKKANILSIEDYEKNYLGAGLERIYNINNNGVITAYNGNEKDIIIPLMINKIRVTAIGTQVFRNKQLDSVKIPFGVTSIEHNAFSNNHLTEIIIPSSVTYIGHGAFSSNQLERITFPSDVNFIGEHAFSENSISSVIIPPRVTAVMKESFSNNQITRLTIHSGITSIGEKAFHNNKLPNLTIPQGVTRIEAGAFSSNMLITMTVPSSVNSIGKSAFHNNRITNITIGKNVTLTNDSKSDVNNSFPYSFDVFYYKNKRIEGTYLYRGGSWRYNN